MIHYLVAGIIDLILGGIALAKKRSDATKSFAITTVCVAAWSFELYLLSSLTDKALLELLFPILRTGMFLIAPALALLTWRLAGSRSRQFLHWVLIPGFIVGLGLGVANTFFFPTELRAVDYGYLPNVDGIYHIFVANFIWCMLASLGLVGLQYSHATVREQQKMKWLLIALALTFLFSCAAIYLMSYDFYLSQLIGVIPNLVLVGALFYAVLRHDLHDLMDIRTLISTAAARTCVVALFALGYFTLISVPSIQSNQASAVLAVFFLLFSWKYTRV